MKLMGWLKILLGIIFLPAFISSFAHAEVGSILSKFHPYIALQEEYSDNINLTSANRKDDFITTVAPGLRFSTSPLTPSLMPGQIVATPLLKPGWVVTPGQFPQPPPVPDPWGVDLNYLLGLVFYAKNPELNYVSHAGTLNTWYTFDRRFTVRLRDNFIRSEEPREREFAAGAPADQFLIGVQRERAVYTRNVLEPTVDYQFGREDLISLYYRNNIYQTESSSSQNSQENYINPRLIYWFDIRNGVELEYGLTRGDFDRSPDLWGHMARARYMYRFDPRTSIFGDYIYLRRDFEPLGIDYNVHNPTIGIQHAFSPTLTAIAQAGYYWSIPESGSTTQGISYSLGLTQAMERTTLTFFSQGGYRENYFTAQNLGFTQYYRSIARISHQFTERTNSSLSGSYEIVDQSSGQRDNIWRIYGNAYYLALKWLAFSLTLSYLEDDSNVATAGYRESRAALWVILYP